MSKISKYKKERIVKEILKRKFNDSKEAVKNKIVLRCEELISEELKGIPIKACDFFIRKSNYVYVSDSDAKYRGNSDTFYLSEAMPRPAGDHWHFNTEKDSSLKKNFKKYLMLNKDVSEAKDILWAVMNSCNTSKQLLDTLPEIEQILKDLFD